MTQVMSAGQSRTWRIPLIGDAHAAASPLLESVLFFPRLQTGKRAFHISTCMPPPAPGGEPGQPGAFSPGHACVQFRLDSPAESEVELVQIVEGKGDVESLGSDCAEPAVALIIATGDNVLTGPAALLRRLAEVRQQALAPSGFPVFILLASAGWGRDWPCDQAVIQNRLLKESGLIGDPSERFIDLRIEKTPASPDCGNDNAALFSRCLDAGLDYGESMLRAEGRLRWTSSGATAALIMMLLLALGLAFRPEPPAIAVELNALRALTANRPAWLHEPFGPKIKRLGRVENDPNFDTLSPLDRIFVRDGLHELRDYQEYRVRLLDVDLHRPRSRAELTALGAELTGGRLAVPVAYRERWRGTNAYDYHEVLVKDWQALGRAIDQMAAWYADRTTELNRLYAFPNGPPRSQNEWAAWLARSQSALAVRWPHSPGDPIPGAVMLTYVAVIQSPEVAAAHRQWTLDADRLDRLRSLILVMGLGGPLPNGKPAPLNIGPGFQAAEAAQRLDDLGRLAPDLGNGPLPSVPEAIWSDLRRAQAKAYRNLILAGQRVIQQHFAQVSGIENNWRAWQKLNPYLSRPDDLLPWRTLSQIVQRLRGEPPGDPIDALAVFLKRDHFDLNPQEAELRLPIPAAALPKGDLVIDLDGPNAQWLFAISGEPVRDNASHVFRYRFKLTRGASTKFVPGDRIRGSLSVSRPDQPGDWSLVWDRPSNTVWAFDALVRIPRWLGSNGLVGDNGPPPPARLIMLPAASWPSLPDLLPPTPGHLP
jgi:hypothetical protein